MNCKIHLNHNVTFLNFNIFPVCQDIGLCYAKQSLFGMQI
jgi:hypothetical protein